jgi:adenosylcobinamide-phosphate synthase
MRYDFFMAVFTSFMPCLPLLFGWFLDLLFGDPERLPHPVVCMGRWIAFGEKKLNHGRFRKTKGALFVVCSLVLLYFLTVLLLRLVYAAIVYVAALFSVNSFGYVTVSFCFVSGIIVFYCLAGHTLRREVRMVFEAVDCSVEDGRRQVARIVGRDTESLSPQECRAAALETLAENLSDGVVAPLFWFFVLSVPGMVVYKMINTFDSMIGYRNERYKDFGCWAAKIDDAANYIPARITAVMLVVSYKLLLMWRKRRHRDMKRYPGFGELMGFVMHFGRNHASPNSGFPEAALAGILDCRFGGGHYYFGEYVYKPYIGVNIRSLTTNDMHESCRISFVVECIMVILLVILIFFLQCLYFVYNH